ncbi:hypothetical protein THIOSC15_1400008 [uncultured Thiomicrorhabdus sp.]
MKPQIEDENGEVWDIDDISTLLSDIKKLEQQNAELMAMLDLSRKAYEALQSNERETYNKSAKFMGKFLAGHKSAPLNHIKADAIEELINQPFVKFYTLDDDESQYIIEGDWFNDYANQLREESK